MRTQIFLNALLQGFLVNFTPFLNFLLFACIPVKSWKAKASEDSNKTSHQNAEWWCWMTQVECPQQTRVGATSILKVPHCLKFVLEFESYSGLHCMAMVNHHTKHTTFLQDCFQRHSQVEHRGLASPFLQPISILHNRYIGVIVLILELATTWEKNIDE